MAIKLINAYSWTVSTCFFSIRSAFGCGKCEGMNYKEKVRPINVGKIEIAFSICKYCGAANVFHDPNGNKYVYFP